MTFARMGRLVAAAVLAGWTTLAAGAEEAARFAPTTAPAPAPILAALGPLRAGAPVVPGTPGTLLAPAPPSHRATTLTLEMGNVRACTVSLIGLGAVMTVPVGGPFVVGGEAFHGESVDPFGGTSARGGVLGLLGGVEVAGDHARARLQLRLGIGNAAASTLPQAALRGEASLVIFRRLVLGLWGAAGTEFGRPKVTYQDAAQTRVGAMVFGGGVSLGLTFRPGGRTASAATEPPEAPETTTFDEGR